MENGTSSGTSQTTVAGANERENRPVQNMLPYLPADAFNVALCRRHGTAIPVRKLMLSDGDPVDLYTIHVTVMKLGGAIVADAFNLWPKIGSELGLARSPESGSQPAASSPIIARQLMDIYRTYLLDIEHILVQRIVGQKTTNSIGSVHAQLASAIVPLTDQLQGLTLAPSKSCTSEQASGQAFLPNCDHAAPHPSASNIKGTVTIVEQEYARVGTLKNARKPFVPLEGGGRPTDSEIEQATLWFEVVRLEHRDLVINLPRSTIPNEEKADYAKVFNQAFTHAESLVPKMPLIVCGFSEKVARDMIMALLTVYQQKAMSDVGHSCYVYSLQNLRYVCTAFENWARAVPYQQYPH